MAVGKRNARGTDRRRKFVVEAMEARTLLSAVTSFTSRGPGGGGAFFEPSFSPYNANELYVASDMTGVYHTTNLGQSWQILDFRELEGGRNSSIQFTNNPNILYSVDTANDNSLPVVSQDGGHTWTDLPGWSPYDGVYGIWADPANSNEVIVSDYESLYFSSDGGQTFTQKFTSPDTDQGCYIAGVFFNGSSIYVGTNQGLLTSNDNGGTFTLSPLTGLPAGTAMFSFAGAAENGVVRFFCVALQYGDVYPGMEIEGVDNSSYSGVWRFDLGSSSWVAADSGIPAGEYPHFVSMAQNDVNTVYVAGTNDSGYPTVSKSTNAGASWSDVLDVIDNQNVITGWQGYGGDQGWDWGQEALGFEVSPVNSSELAFTDFGYVHISDDGGDTWRQAYVSSADQNPAGSPTPQHKAYEGIGLEDTSALWLTWANSDTMIAGYTDIEGVRSTDGGVSWAFPTNSGLAQNTIYNIASVATPSVPSGLTLYAATSSIHDIYQSTHLTNASVDSGNGNILYSTDDGNSWSLLHDFGAPVIWCASDPTDPNRMYASVVSGTIGGIYVTNDLNDGVNAVWTQLPAPPRTQGHPFNIDVLKDGTLVVTYSALIGSSGFTASSGVFVSTNQGQTWSDRSAPGMDYYTKDITVDPTDPTQDTWYVAVRSGWGGAANNLGGLYKTTNRGLTWSLVFDADSVESCTISPTTGAMYVATLESGLWYCANPDAASPNFVQLTAYPFQQPERIFINPYNPNDIWVTSFGYGIAEGSVVAGSVAGQYLFYNGSPVYDAGMPAAGADDAAIAPDKQALLPGGTAQFANYSGYVDGINGVMIDLADSTTAPTLSDFQFLVGDSANPSQWTTAPTPSGMLVRYQAGAGGSTRVEFTWATRAIENEWLQITVDADSDTGLSSPDVFYFGNLIGSSGQPATGGEFTVGAADVTSVWNDLHSFLDPATITDANDFNRDGRVDATDEMIAQFATGDTLLQLAAPATASAARTTAEVNAAVDTKDSKHREKSISARTGHAIAVPIVNPPKKTNALVAVITRGIVAASSHPQMIVASKKK